MDDERILQLLFDRSEAGLEAMEKSYGPACRQLAKNILQNDRDAEECVSDAWLAAWNAIPPERPRCLGPWLMRVVRNRALSRYRHNTAQRRNGAFDAALEELAELLPARDGSPEDALLARELSASLNRFLDGLDKTSRVIFLRRYWFGDPVEAIARNLGMTRNNVSVRLHRTREKLRDHLKKEGYLP